MIPSMGKQGPNRRPTLQPFADQVDESKLAGGESLVPMMNLMVEVQRMTFHR